MVNRNLSNCICGQQPALESGSVRVCQAGIARCCCCFCCCCCCCEYLSVPLDVSISLNDVARGEPLCIGVIIRHNRPDLGDWHSQWISGAFALTEPECTGRQLPVAVVTALLRPTYMTTLPCAVRQQACLT